MKEFFYINNQFHQKDGACDWISEPIAGDYILWKLSESIGYEKTAEVVLAVAGSDEKLTAAQWLVYPVVMDEIDNTPFSWWKEML